MVMVQFLGPESHINLQICRSIFLEGFTKTYEMLRRLTCAGQEIKFLFLISLTFELGIF